MGSLAGMALRLTDGLEQEAGAGVLEATLYLREAVQGQQRNSWIILSNYSITQTVLSHIIERIVRLTSEFDNTRLPRAKLAAVLENGGGKRTLF